MMRTLFLTISFFFCMLGHSQKEVDVLIIGGGAGGTSAAIQAARMGASVQILEKTEWLGGMLTSAGVSAIDGNHGLPSGIWGEFRQKLYEYYGGPKEVATGWVSHTLFEPSVGNAILTKMATIPNLDIVFNARYGKVEREQEKWKVNYRVRGKERFTKAIVLIDATETGELLPLVGAEYRLGMDSKAETGEAQAPGIGNAMVQDLTYAAILKDVGRKKDTRGLVDRPTDYDPKVYACACHREKGEMFGSVSDCEQMLNYGKLPNNKYMINWPNCGNDYFVDWPQLSETETKEAMERAKRFTQGFIHYIQNELGFTNLRLEKEFPTKDGYPMIPYHREGRRVKGEVFLVADHLERPYDFELYKTGIAVGDYPIDHHHDKNPNAPKIEFINIKVPSYSIPMGCLIPKGMENFLVADKNISVSNIVNGTTRLQPVVLGIGQASGAIAALAVLDKVSTTKVSIRKVQQALLNSKAYLMPFIDVPPTDRAFESIQRIGASGVLEGYGVPYKWANETWFYPERRVSEFELKSGLLGAYPKLMDLPASGAWVSPKYIVDIMNSLTKGITLDDLKELWIAEIVSEPFSETVPLDRRTTSILIDKLLNPFEREVDFNGK
ncbi:FAD-dependent oxidoreductase [Muricauda sp. SCSIO 64092]|uniref:FAD-dependent oxidoreductase n=1 Tax=Allomuricauda sp. SCSIO 64092 TaxID=2908842 RepID=UPI001FF41D2D|nr:FAD-dependent oxidoreductase [Muricauda sp. SCSIO 64092]UOY05232.1 FAD-dependent oxidoreductase [Muricauda sp. SCSIO 64092]